MVQVLDSLSNQCEGLMSNSSTIKKIKKENEPDPTLRSTVMQVHKKPPVISV
jgi:hypothetical protein